MPIGQNETIAIEPVWISRVVFKESSRQAALCRRTPQGDRHIGHTHRRSWMTRVGLLNGIHCQRANRVGHHLRSCHVG